MSTTRRTHLASLGLVATGLATSGLVAATATPARAATDPVRLTARRTELTLPDLPTLGLTYICLLDLFDEDDAQVGTASAGATIVEATVEGPVVLASVVLHLADGEVHYQRVMDRFGDYPRTATGAILGGTGAYHDISGEVDITWPDPDQIDLLLRRPSAGRS